MLGWKVLEEGEYRIELPRLSPEEEKLVVEIEERFKKEIRKKKVGSKEECKKLIQKIISDYAKNNSLQLDIDQKEYLGEFATAHIYGNKFIEYILKDPEVEEVSVIGVNKPVYVFLRNKGWKTANACFTEESAIKEAINKMGSELGRRITLQKPVLNATLADGSRMHASLDPVSEGEITIRKFREIPISPKELCLNKTIDKRTMALLSLIVQGDNNLLIAGNTASGKTTFLNALFSFVPKNERVIITEETPEISIPHEHQVRMVMKEEMGVDLSQLIYNSLRMRPDRTIVGEVRNKKETEALFDVLTSGQARGSFATFHAQNSEEAIARIKSFGIGNVSSIDYILILRRMLSYKDRKNIEMRRAVELYSTKLGLIGRYDSEKDCFETNISDKLLEIAGSKLNLNKSETRKEIETREKTIDKTNEEFSRFYKKIQKEFYGLD
ncbi:MAG: ATPase, T2SS/T4P/T4SS family [Candidatus Micrarchaeota archaeon]